MIRRPVRINLNTGLEARPVAQLVQVASQFNSEIYVESGAKKVNAKSIMGMMTLGLDMGEEITLSANGEDDAEAMAVWKNILTVHNTGKSYIDKKRRVPDLRFLSVFSARFSDGTNSYSNPQIRDFDRDFWRRYCPAQPGGRLGLRPDGFPP